MDVEWDPAKARSNLKKHGVSFSDAEMVLYDPLAISIEDLDAAGEDRYLTIGSDALGRVLVVCYVAGRDRQIVLPRGSSNQAIFDRHRLPFPLQVGQQPCPGVGRRSVEIDYWEPVSARSKPLKQARTFSPGGKQ